MINSYLPSGKIICFKQAMLQLALHVNDKD